MGHELTSSSTHLGAPILHILLHQRSFTYHYISYYCMTDIS